ncbi:MAG: hypothetical protein ABIT20_19220 [Gemmatimonadaceae bacterium]
MNLQSRYTLAGGAFALLAILAGCERNALPTDPRVVAVPQSSTREIAPAVARIERACAQLAVHLKNKRQDGASVTSVVNAGCGSALRIILADTVQYDYVHNLVRVPILLENGGQHPLGAPTQLYGWDDSLVVTSPGNGHTGDLRFLRADSSIASGTALHSGAVMWKYGAEPAGTTPQRLAAGSRSGVRWIEIEAFDKAKTFTASLQAEASTIPAAVISVIVDSTLTGSLVHDTAAYVGDAIAYAYTPRQGYTNVQVRIDGVAAPASGSLSADSVHHLLIATADRVVTVSHDLDGLLATARSVLTAADVPAAYQQWIDAVDSHVQGAVDVQQALREIDDVEYLAFGDVKDVDELARVDEALAGQTFHVGPEAPVISAARIPSATGFLQSGGRSSLTMSAPARPLSSLIQAQGDTIESTTFVYINGMVTPGGGAARTAATLRQMIGTVNGLNSPRIFHQLIYNRNFAANPPTPDWRLNRCTFILGAKLTSGKMGGNSWPGQMSLCMKDSTYRHWTDQDIMECLRQVIGILANTDAPEADAIKLGSFIQGERTAGRHVIVMAHSQGNLMTNQALHHIALNPVPGLDSTCIGVVSMASPTSARWDISDHNLAKIVVDGDQVPMIANLWPKTSTVLSRSVQDTAQQRGYFGGGAYYLLKEGFTTLHSVDDSYLKYETRTQVMNGIMSTYAACTVSIITAPSVKIEASKVFQLDLSFFNTFGDFLSRKVAPDQLSSQDSSVVVPLGDGTFRAAKKGVTTVVATHAGRKVVTQVEVTAPVAAPIVGAWVGTYVNLDASASRGPFTVTVDGAIGSATTKVHLEWTNLSTGQRYTGDLIGNVMRSPNNVAGYMVYNKVGRHDDFTRYVSISASADNASGQSYDYGTYYNYWVITLARVEP